MITTNKPTPSFLQARCPSWRTKLLPTKRCTLHARVLMFETFGIMHGSWQPVVKVVMWSRAHLMNPGWIKPHTHSNPTNLALFRHKITLYRFNRWASYYCRGLNYNSTDTLSVSVHKYYATDGLACDCLCCDTNECHYWLVSYLFLTGSSQCKLLQTIF